MRERIKKIRQHFKLTQESFGEKVGMTRGAISSIEYGTAQPTEIFIKSVCREFHIDYGWLKDGIGEMFSSEGDEVLAAIDDLMTGENETAKALLRAMSKFTDAQWAAFDQMLCILEKERGR